MIRSEITAVATNEYYRCPKPGVASTVRSLADRCNARVVQLTWAAVLALAGGSCDRPQPNPAERAVASAESSQSVRRFVAFRESTFSVVSLEAPITPPIAVGSTLAADLLWSSDPSVVTIDAAGNLIAHKNGTALVRTSTGATLEVIVNAVTVLQIVPNNLDLFPGSTTTVRVIGDGRELPITSYQWRTTSPSTAMASGATVYAGFTPGSATLTVRSGNATSTLTVAVREPKRQISNIRP